MNLKNQSNTSFFLKKKYLRYIVALLTLTCILLFSYYLKNNNYDNLKHFNNENESYEYINNLLKDGDLVLFKGSHGMHLSNIIKYLVDNQK